MTAMKRLAICLLNISEGRNAKIVESVASAAVSSSTSQEISSADQQLGMWFEVLHYEVLIFGLWWHKRSPDDVEAEVKVTGFRYLLQGR